MQKFKMEIALIVLGAIIMAGGFYLLLNKKKPVPVVSQTQPIKHRAKAYQTSNLLAVNKEKGDAFEHYVAALFDTVSGRYKMKEWRSDKISSTGMYPASNQNPDMQFEFRGDQETFSFALECKWRKRFDKGVIEWAHAYQIKNYLAYEKATKIKVFVVIGVGGTPDKPERMFIAPLQKVALEVFLTEFALKPFERIPTRKFFYRQHDQTIE